MKGCGCEDIKKGASGRPVNIGVGGGENGATGGAQGPRENDIFERLSDELIRLEPWFNLGILVLTLIIFLTGRR